MKMDLWYTRRFLSFKIVLIMPLLLFLTCNIPGCHSCRKLDYNRPHVQSKGLAFEKHEDTRNLSSFMSSYFTRVEFTLAGRNLAPMDANDSGFADPYVIVQQNGVGPEQESDSIDDTQNPTWGKIFYADYSPGSDDHVTIQMWDDDPTSCHDLMGYNIVYLKNMLEVGKTLQEEVWNVHFDNYYTGQLIVSTVRTTLMLR